MLVCTPTRHSACITTHSVISCHRKPLAARLDKRIEREARIIAKSLGLGSRKLPWASFCFLRSAVDRACTTEIRPQEYACDCRLGSSAPTGSEDSVAANEGRAVVDRGGTRQKKRSQTLVSALVRLIRRALNRLLLKVVTEWLGESWDKVSRLPAHLACIDKRKDLRSACVCVYFVFVCDGRLNALRNIIISSPC